MPTLRVENGFLMTIQDFDTASKAAASRRDGIAMARPPLNEMLL